MKQLRAEWNIDTSDIYLNEDIVRELGNQMQKEMDFGILCSVYKEIGWIEVKIDWPRMTELLAHEIKEWCKANLNGQYKARGRTWIFEKEKDASMFILRWS